MERLAGNAGRCSKTNSDSLIVVEFKRSSVVGETFPIALIYALWRNRAEFNCRALTSRRQKLLAAKLAVRMTNCVDP